MAELKTADSSPDTDRDFDPTAEMLVHDYDDEQTLAEEEQMSNSDASNELDELQKEGDMPIEELLAMYGYGSGGALPVSADASDKNESRSSSEEEILSNQDLTLDKEEVARDLLAHDEDSNKETSANDLLQCVKPVFHQLPSDTVRLLRSADQEDDSDDSNDADYQPTEDSDWKKTIQVGSEYQAIIPDGLNKYGDAPGDAYENEDRLLWDPHKLDNKKVEDFLAQVAEQNKLVVQGVHAVPQGAHVRDDEQALFLLQQCGHNTEEALRRLKMQAVPPTDPMSLWSEEECRNFENGLKTYGKDFYLIQQNKVKTRIVGELVQFYYLWKKTERHDMFANKTRLEKKKYALHPGVTDYMERFLDEQEAAAAAAVAGSGNALHKERPASPLHSLLYCDPKRHEIQQAKTPTQEEIAAVVEMVQKVVDHGELASKLSELAPQLNSSSPTLGLDTSSDTQRSDMLPSVGTPTPECSSVTGSSLTCNGDSAEQTVSSGEQTTLPSNVGTTTNSDTDNTDPPLAKRAKLEVRDVHVTPSLASGDAAPGTAATKGGGRNEAAGTSSSGVESGHHSTGFPGSGAGDASLSKSETPETSSNCPSANTLSSKISEQASSVVMGDQGESNSSTTLCNSLTSSSVAVVSDRGGGASNGSVTSSNVAAEPVADSTATTTLAPSSPVPATQAAVCESSTPACLTTPPLSSSTKTVASDSNSASRMTTIGSAPSAAAAAPHRSLAAETLAH